MSISPSAIADGIATMLGAASVLGSINVVSKGNYQILETEVPIACVIHWTDLNSQPMTFGMRENREQHWNFLLQCFLRVTDDPNAVINNVWLYTDKIKNCLESDSTLQNTVDATGTIGAQREPNRVLAIGGQSWLPIDFTVEAVVY